MTIYKSKMWAGSEMKQPGDGRKRDVVTVAVTTATDIGHRGTTTVTMELHGRIRVDFVPVKLMALDSETFQAESLQTVFSGPNLGV